MTSRERTLEELLAALVRLLDRLDHCPHHCVGVNKGLFSGAPKDQCEPEYRRLRRRIARELSNKPN